MRKNLQLNPQGDGLAFLAMISWGCYSALIKKIGEWEYPIVAVTRRVYFYGILFLIPVLIQQKASWKPEILMKPEVLANFLFLVLHEKMTMASVAGAAQIFIGLVISQKKQFHFNRKENHHMFERIKPTTQIRTVALPGDIADTLRYVYLCNKIEKRGIIIKGNHGGLRVVHNARIRDTYVPIEESWLAEFQKRFPDYELPTSDIAPYSQFGAVIFFSCFETNLSDEDIWTIVEIIINDDDSDRELLYTKMREKAAEENNRLFVLENL